MKETKVTIETIGNYRIYVSDLCEWTELKPSAIYRGIENGGLPSASSHPLDGRAYWTLDTLIAWSQSHEETPEFESHE